MTQAKKIETLTNALKNIRQIQKNPVAIYGGCEEARGKVINGTAESALRQVKKK